MGEVERVLAGIFAEVLGLEDVSPRDNFFEIGGDSIIGLRIVARAQDEGIAFAIHDLFRTPTIRELASGLGRQDATGESRTEPFALISEGDRRRIPEA